MHYFAAFLLLISINAYGYSQEQIEAINTSVANSEATKFETSLKNDFESRQKVDKAMNVAILAATAELHNVGKHQDAARIASEWKTYTGFLSKGTVGGVGDHNPVLWLYNTWLFLNNNLGTEKMKFFHLDDIWEFAYTIPVVFWCEDGVNAEEFKPHFVMLAGATSYWVAMIACSVATSGAPYALICSPAGALCEQIVTNRIAPLFSNYFWNLSCN